MTYQTIITGAESTAELLELRRKRIKNRRMRKACPAAEGFASGADHNAAIIRFPTPESPKIA